MTQIARVLLIVLVLALHAAAQNRIEQEVRTIAFGSCLRQDRPAPVLDAVVAARPDVFVFLGDNIYADTTEESVFRETWATLGAIPAYQQLSKQARILATWDDHDYGANDAGVEFGHKHLAKRMMLEFFAEPADSPRQGREGVYDSYTFGPDGRRVQVILLDTRWFRDPLELDPAELPRRRYKPTSDTSRTLLGETQWAWLADQLRKPAELRVIGTSIQVLPTRHKFELWNNFPHERERLLRLLDAEGVGPVLLLSGDRHFAEITRIDLPSGKPLIDVTSSSLNASSTSNRNEVNPDRLGPFVGQNNFGLLTIDFPSRQIHVRLKGESGQVLSETTLRL